MCERGRQIPLASLCQLLVGSDSASDAHSTRTERAQGLTVTVAVT